MKMRTNLKLVIALALCVMLAPLHAATIYVDADAPGANNGSSWFNAYRFLQDALAAANANDEIRIAQGTYKPHLSASSIVPDRYASFTLKNGVEVKGGYYGHSFIGSVPPDTRNIYLYITYLSGDIYNNDYVVDVDDPASIEQLLTHNTRLDNSYSVVDANYTDPNAILDGCTIIAGNANGADDVLGENVYHRGGGLASVMGSATINNCHFTLNSGHEGGALYTKDGRLNITNTVFSTNFGDEFGGAIYAVSGSPQIYNCEFENNYANYSGYGYGGAIYHAGYNKPYISDTHFINNYAGEDGGAIFIGRNIIIENCTFDDNYANTYGGAIRIRADQGEKPLISGCLFLNNESEIGGAISGDEGDPTIKQCTFIGNMATVKGGALDCSWTNYTLINCLINGNYAGDSGGGINFYRANANIINSTFAHNYAEEGKGNSAACEYSSLVSVHNSILWSGSTEFYVDALDYESIIDMNHTTISDYWPGPGNNYLNPMFADPNGPDGIPGTLDDDLRPMSGSPCVDSGNNNLVPKGIDVDLDYNPRFQDDPQTPNTGVGIPPIVDRGAYEWKGGSTGDQPIADAGKDQTIYTNGSNSLVNLDGSESYDPHGRPLNYTWKWTINNITYVSYDEKPTILLPIGQHYIQLIVSNGIESSQPDYVVITVIQTGSQIPVANAGDDQTVTAGSHGTAQVTLDGSQSFEPNGRPLSYAWTWSIGNQNYHAVGINPVITLPVGVHTIQLIVSNGMQSSAPDYVHITVLGQSGPVADAGKDQSVYADVSGNANVTLDGSGSTAPSGETLTYLWRWTVDNQTRYALGVSPTISLPLGVHTITLVVYTSTDSSDPDTVQISVLPSQSQKPIADAGKDQTVNANTSGWASVTLDGSGSSDPSGRPLSYTWRYMINNEAYYAFDVSPTVNLPIGEHIIELRVNNGQIWSEPDYVTITVLSSQVYDTWIYPGQVNPYDDSIYVMTLMDITNIPANQIDLSRPILLQPGNIVALGQHVTERNTGDVTATVFAFWDEDDVLAANPSTGNITLTVQGWLKNGQPFSGSDSVFISH